MALSFDAAGSGGNAGGATITWSHNVTTANKKGVIFASTLGNGSANITSLKYAGTAMTKIIAGTQGGTNVEVELWYLLNPPSGLGTFNGTFSASVPNEIDGVSASYFGVDQSQPILGSVRAIGTTQTSGSVTRTLSQVNSFWVGNIGWDTNNGTTNIGNQRGTFGAGGNLMFADAATGTLRWTNASASFGALGAELKASPAGTSLIQSTGTSTLAANSLSASWASNTTTGNLIVVGITITNAATLGTVTSVTDTQGNTYVKAISKAGTAVKVVDTELWYASNITGGAGSVTVNNVLNAISIYAREYSGFNTLDVTASNIGSSSTPNSGTSVVTAFANELLIVATGDEFGGTQSYTAAGIYGDIVGTTTTATGLSMEDAIVSTTGAQTGTQSMAVADEWVSVLASFYNFNGGVSGYRNLLGVGI